MGEDALSPAVAAYLEQLLSRFGDDQVSEVSGIPPVVGYAAYSLTVFNIAAYDGKAVINREANLSVVFRLKPLGEGYSGCSLEVLVSRLDGAPRVNEPLQCLLMMGGVSAFLRSGVVRMAMPFSVCISPAGSLAISQPRLVQLTGKCRLVNITREGMQIPTRLLCVPLFLCC